MQNIGSLLFSECSSFLLLKRILGLKSEQYYEAKEKFFVDVNNSNNNNDIFKHILGLKKLYENNINNNNNILEGILGLNKNLYESSINTIKKA